MKDRNKFSTDGKSCLQHRVHKVCWIVLLRMLHTMFLASGPNGGKVEQELTYSQLADKMSALASRLLESGLAAGDR